MKENKTILLYGKNTIVIIVIESLLTLILFSLGVYFSSISNIVPLIMMVFCAAFFVFDIYKKIKYKLVIADNTIYVSNDELPLNKKIQYELEIHFEDIIKITREESKANSKNQVIESYTLNKPISYLVFYCKKDIKRINVSYLSEQEINDIIDIVLTSTSATFE